MALEQQSPDIAQGVHIDRNEEDIGAGDQVSTSNKYFSISVKLFQYCPQKRPVLGLKKKSFCSAGLDVWVRHR